MKKRILFVDDDPLVLAGLRRLLRSRRAEWDMEFFDDPESALARIGETHFDVVVSDMRMPKIDGSELLKRVRDASPSTIRIILSGQSQDEELLQSVGPAHLYLSKPCKSSALQESIENACHVNQHVSNENVSRLVANIETLPSLPQNVVELLRLLNASDSTIQEVGTAISQDLGLTTRVLQLANSGRCGLRHEVTSPTQAITYLGMEQLKPIVLAAGAFAQCQANQELIKSVTEHSMAVGTSACQLALAETGSSEIANKAMIAGTLHDIGKLILAQSLPEQYRKVCLIAEKGEIPTWMIEDDEFGANHAEIGAYVLASWGFPTVIVEAIAFHHSPEKSSQSRFTPLVAVHIANAFERSTEINGETRDYLESLECRLTLSDWHNSIHESNSGLNN